MFGIQLFLFLHRQPTAFYRRNQFTRKGFIPAAQGDKGVLQPACIVEPVFAQHICIAAANDYPQHPVLLQLPPLPLRKSRTADFDLLRRAYIEVRYNKKNFIVTKADIDALISKIELLRNLVEKGLP